MKSEVKPKIAVGKGGEEGGGEEGRGERGERRRGSAVLTM